MNEPIHITEPESRGPSGTETMGVSVAIPAQELPPLMSGQDWADLLREYRPQVFRRLEEHVGGAKFRTEPTMSLTGPHPDLLQGPIYVLTLAAWFDPADLTVDCPAYKARAS